MPQGVHLLESHPTDWGCDIHQRRQLGPCATGKGFQRFFYDKSMGAIFLLRPSAHEARATARMPNGIR